MRINLPTWLTLFRVALLPVMVMAFYWPFRGHNITAAIVFALAGITDWLDGYLARRLNLTSKFGAFLDPVADKLMVAVTLFMLVETHRGGWPGIVMAVTSAIIVGREISISALREWMAEIGMRATVRVAFLGKFKTVMQMLALIVLILQHEKDAEALRLYHIGEGLLVIAGILTIWSGLYYLRAAWPALHDDPIPVIEQDKNA
ncbi:CDP-diacylglycerol--glycerol-3-phosphate 3-phosphatidyltransferase [Dyella caseinilytica]|uniref:CDP-diacylglycerol--glycerol-3-phosphate 3-phosphatidyltransferase n=1 Tax=Dyella caseinilytica TaxID=1849581 RepID=A0ABX7GPR5_9GAMM|nr:CDP-diacylglycerol--glycerol-3-phosphate 3-phosphatidyltransferase [Dyella caseinilytica]QRN51978.1 CDP-diacylglycerol--glycerol-3-phosphate 3-phosphatidyltransferase [Dyella caseinilytica]GGA04081.1 CDP-diacylglycerol--glycerol-3-phosphate 3-phosphatidyltransferase [Dyella caseinilytica]